MKLFFLYIASFLFFNNFCQAQSTYFKKETPYSLRYKKDIPISLGIAGAVFLSLKIRENKPNPNFSIGSLTQNDIDKINFFDRGSAAVWNIKAKRKGAYFKYTATIGLPISLMAFPGNFKSRVSLAFLFFQGRYLSGSIVEIAKGLTHRFRPFAYLSNEQINSLEGKAKEKFDEDITSSSINASFFSGDATGTAYGFIFFAKAFNDYFPDSKLKNTVWAISFASIAMQGYFRVKSGKHFPTDVIVGSIVGGGIGYLIPYLHKNKLADDSKLSLNYFGNGLTIIYKL